ncbi:MAG: DUF2721 domain-containing protein [Pyrinomonadaceae bacterium]
MILSTSGRLGRVVDRVRALSDRLEEMAEKPLATDIARERQAVIFSQLDKLTSRARILQRSMYLLRSPGIVCSDQRGHRRGRNRK